MSQETSSKGNLTAIVVIAAFILAGAAVFSSRLPTRMPDDPFKGDDQLYVVTFRVEWDEDPPRTQDIHYEVVNQEENTFPGVETSPWEHSTTAKAGDELVLDSIQSEEGLLRCYILIDGEVIGRVEVTSSAGCLLEEFVP